MVLGITERALSTRPADLLRTVERVRAFGWAVALDDVGAETLSLAFMPLLRPDVVKLDLRLVQERPGQEVAEIMNAVNDYAESSGALLLAEGIEHEQHLTMARALGARLGQGWMFGRPAAGPAPGYAVAELVLPASPAALTVDESPFGCLPARTPWWNEIFLAPVTDADGTVLQYIGVQNDVTARVEAERVLERERDRAQSYLARIEQLAFTDALTGLANRRRVEERLEVALWEAGAAGEALALLFLDLDRFKAVNDRHGHAAGDELLVATGRRLRERLRRGDLLARLGGDEFLVLLTGLDPGSAREQAGRVADELAAAVARPVVLRGEQVLVGASIGVGVLPEDGEDFSTLLHRADLRMYAVKHPERTTR